MTPSPGPSNRPSSRNGTPVATRSASKEGGRNDGRERRVIPMPATRTSASASAGCTRANVRERLTQARFGGVTLPPPGGDVIGRRRVDTHFLALERLGAEVTVGDAYKLEGKLKAADIFLDEPSVTGTENALMAAVRAPGTTVLRNAASEPHVQDLARFLVSLGAAIDGIGSNTFTIEGGRPLRASPHTVGPDHIEIGSFIGLAAVTGGAVTIDGVRGDDLRSTPLAFERPGVRPRLAGAKLVGGAGQEGRILPEL